MGWRLRILETARFLSSVDEHIDVRVRRRKNQPWEDRSRRFALVEDRNYLAVEVRLGHVIEPGAKVGDP